MHLKNSLSYKLLLICLITSALFSSVIIVTYTQQAQKIYIEEQRNILNNQLQNAITSIDTSLQNVSQLCFSLSTNHTIIDFLTSYDAVNNVYDEKFFSVLEDTPLIVHSYNLSQDVAKLIIAPQGSDSFIGLASTMFGNLDDYERSQQMVGEQKNTFLLVENLFFHPTTSNYNYLVSYQTELTSPYNNVVYGVVSVYLNLEFIISEFDFLFSNGYDFCISTPDKTYKITENSIQIIDDYVPSNLQGNLSNNWVVSIPPDQLEFHLIDGLYKNEFILVMLLFTILFCMVLYFILHKTINQPVIHICEQLQHVSHGHFSESIPLSTQDEFGKISKEITIMAQNISQLMESEIILEKKKNHYQFKMLQNQISPHFLYNTLNSIKWLGDLNGVASISKITVALTRFLRKTANTQLVTTTLQNEMELIEDYRIIQSFRYGDTFVIRNRIPTELLNCEIIFFMLQPIVENALFHGVTKGHTKIIDIYAKKIDSDLVIFITDNGQGISREKLSAILKNVHLCSETPLSATQGLALSNIHERIRMEYGNPYGINIRSKYGHFTQIVLRTPYKNESEL